MAPLAFSYRPGTFSAATGPPSPSARSTHCTQLTNGLEGYLRPTAGRIESTTMKPNDQVEVNAANPLTDP